LRGGSLGKRRRTLRNRYRDLQRLRKIASVLAKCGLGELADVLRARYHLFRFPGPAGNAELGRGERFRLALEELGPTFVKLGQILSLRPDLVPPDIASELRKLQDEALPFPFSEVKAQIESELGQSLATLFQEFEEKPLAAASLAQVHRARTRDGELVAVKVQRPGIREVIDADLDILFEIAGLVERHLPDGELYNPVGTVEEFARSIREELDFTREGRHMEIFKHNFAGDETIYVPKVFWEYTTSRVLTMEYIEGIKISDLERLEEVGLDRKVIARNGVQATLKQIFEYGFFHADPHPGNLLVLPGNVIVPLDFGLVGRLDEVLRGLVAELLVGFVKKDVNRIIGVLRDMGGLDTDVDMIALRADILGLIDYYYGVPLKQLDFRRIFEEGMRLVRNYQIKIPTGFVLMGKALVTEEGVGRMLDPDLDMVSMAKPYVQRVLLRRYDPRRQLAKWLEILDGYHRMLARLPTDVQAALTGLAELGRTSASPGENRSRDRLSIALVIAALFLGSSLIVQSGTGPWLWRGRYLGSSAIWWRLSWGAGLPFRSCDRGGRKPFPLYILPEGGTMCGSACSSWAS